MQLFRVLQIICHACIHQVISSVTQDLFQKWSRRWFTLRQSCELPGQYFLDYYADRNSRKLKGTIDLDLCEQVSKYCHYLIRFIE